MITDSFSAYCKYLDSVGVAYLTDEPMSLHTTFKIGGAAKVYVTPSDEDALSRAYTAAKDSGLRVTVLGKGSNVLFDDEGYNGVVISTLRLDTISCGGDMIACFAGYSMTSLARYAAERSLAGLSFAYGIPGSVGGAVYMNAGAYNGEVANVLFGSCYLDTNDGKIKTLDAEGHAFAYRYSSFKDHPERIILSSAFKLTHGDPDEIKAEMNDFMERRRTKQPLEFPSAGSVFKRYPGRYTAQMIDEAGLKGFTVGGAQVSEKHAGFIINRGGATCRDVLELVSIIKNKIYELHGIEIECEIIHIDGGCNG